MQPSGEARIAAAVPFIITSNPYTSTKTTVNTSSSCNNTFDNNSSDNNSNNGDNSPLFPTYPYPHQTHHMQHKVPHYQTQQHILSTSASMSDDESLSSSGSDGGRDSTLFDIRSGLVSAGSMKTYSPPSPLSPISEFQEQHFDHIHHLNGRNISSSAALIQSHLHQHNNQLSISTTAHSTSSCLTPNSCNTHIHHTLSPIKQSSINGQIPYVSRPRTISNPHAHSYRSSHLQQHATSPTGKEGNTVLKQEFKQSMMMLRNYLVKSRNKLFLILLVLCAAASLLFVYNLRSNVFSKLRNTLTNSLDDIESATTNGFYHPGYHGGEVLLDKDIGANDLPHTVKKELREDLKNRKQPKDNVDKKPKKRQRITDEEKQIDDAIPISVQPEEVNPKFKVDHIYVINLKIREDRKKKANARLNALGGIFSNFTFFEPVYGEALSDQAIFNHVSITTYKSLSEGRSLDYQLSTKGGIGCYLTHTNIWKDMLEKGYEKVLIFEDDFQIASQYDEIMTYLSHLPKNFDIAFLYYSLFPGSGEFERYNDYWATTSAMRVYGAASYIITQGAAKKLLEKAFPIDLQLDAFINHYITFTGGLRLYSNKLLFGHEVIELYNTNVQDFCWKCFVNIFMDNYVSLEVCLACFFFFMVIVLFFVLRRKYLSRVVVKRAKQNAEQPIQRQGIFSSSPLHTRTFPHKE